MSTPYHVYAVDGFESAHRSLPVWRHLDGNSIVLCRLRLRSDRT
jgi:hypothetical protein